MAGQPVATGGDEPTCTSRGTEGGGATAAPPRQKKEASPLVSPVTVTVTLTQPPGWATVCVIGAGCSPVTRFCVTACTRYPVTSARLSAIQLSVAEPVPGTAPGLICFGVL